MDMVFQSTTLTAITMIAKAASHFMSNVVPTNGDEDEDKSAQDSLIDLPPNSIVQTSKWIYSKAPNGLLFDFGELNMKKKQIIPFIKRSLPANIKVCIRPISNSVAEITILDQNESSSLHKQAYSILKNKGLHLKDKNIWLKPTPTLTMYPNLVSWQLRLSGYPSSMKDDICKHRIANTIESSFGRRNRQDFSRSVLTVDAENVLFSNCTRDRDSQCCSITILVKEYTITPPASINPKRKLIYVPFLKMYLPIEVSRVE